jgi:hypothetical protein
MLELSGLWEEIGQGGVERCYSGLDAVDLRNDGCRIEGGRICEGVCCRLEYGDVGVDARDISACLNSVHKLETSSSRELRSARTVFSAGLFLRKGGGR